jgi:predicted permease
MSAILITVVPVFVLIGLGFFAARARLIDRVGVSGLNGFVFLFAIPALLFRTSMKVDVTGAAPWRLWAAFFGSAAIVWVLAVLVSPRINSLRPTGGATAAIASTFGNLVMMGIPLSFAHWGEKAVIPAALIVAIHAPMHWFFATLRAEWVGAGGGSIGNTIRELVVALAKNPIVVSLFAGIGWGFTGIGLHPVADRTISLLGQAGVPAALFALGLALAGYGVKGNIRGLSVILVLKMAVFPLVASVMAFKVFELPPLQASIVVLFSCLPPGANAYLFATRYKASLAPVSGAIAIGTILALFSVSLVLRLLG